MNQDSVSAILGVSARISDSRECRLRMILSTTWTFSPLCAFCVCCMNEFLYVCVCVCVCACMYVSRGCEFDYHFDVFPPCFLSVCMHVLLWCVCVCLYVCMCCVRLSLVGVT
jgi:hypothetical protein